MIYGYLFFVGYQAFLLLESGKDKSFPEAVNAFENKYSNIFKTLYQNFPKLDSNNLKYIIYPFALMSFSVLSMLFGIFGLFAIASHAFYVYLTNENIVKFVSSLSPKMNINEVVHSVDLEIIMLLAIYLGILYQVVTHFFCCDGKEVKEYTKTENNENTSQKQKQLTRIERPSSQKKKRLS